jgi:cell division cycle 14
VQCEQPKVPTIQKRETQSTKNIEVIQNKVFFAIKKQRKSIDTEGFIAFTIDHEKLYHPFCEDFGPYNLSVLFRFWHKLKTMISSIGANSAPRILFHTSGHPRQVTNSAFLLASFLVMELHLTADQAWQPFATIAASSFVGFRDASHGPADFTLSILDCLGGLARARAARLVDFRDGSFSVEDYEHLDSPANGDVHEVVPGRFVAFKGPTEEGIPAGQLWATRHGRRVFHPAHYAEIFKELGVRAVVRLNEPRYDAAHFARAGMPVAELEFGDCTAPPLGVVFRFFRVADEAEAAAAAGGGDGAVAVHCRAGLGRTGTLIGLWLMRTHGFTAREAIAWLRIVRPGSVLGPQQQFLECMQGKMWRWGALPPDKRAELLRNGCAMTAGAGADAGGGGAGGAGEATAASSVAAAEEAAAAAAAAAMAEAVAGASERRAAARMFAGASVGVIGQT